MLTNIIDSDSSVAVNAENAERLVYGVAYIKYKDGTVVYSKRTGVTLKSLVEHIDLDWDNLTQAQQEGLSGMYKKFSTGMADWNIPNIKNA